MNRKYCLTGCGAGADRTCWDALIRSRRSHVAAETSFNRRTSVSTPWPRHTPWSNLQILKLNDEIVDDWLMAQILLRLSNLCVWIREMDEACSMNEETKLYVPALVGNAVEQRLFGTLKSLWKIYINLLKPSGNFTQTRFNIKKFCVVPTLRLCVLYGSQNKQQLLPDKTLRDWFL
jgi:hypothetical protein